MSDDATTTGPRGWRYADDDGRVPGSVTVRPTTADDDLLLDRIGSERGEQLHPLGTGYAERSYPPDRLEFARRAYRLNTTNPLVAQGRVQIEESVAAPWFGQPGGATVYRFLEPSGRPLSVRELRRFHILVYAPLEG